MEECGGGGGAGGGLKCLSSVLVDSKKERKCENVRCRIIFAESRSLQIRENGVGCFVKWREDCGGVEGTTVENAPLVCFRLERNTWGLSA